MKLIVAIVRPFKVTEILDALESSGTLPGLTVVDCRGLGHHRRDPHDHEPEDVTDFVPRQMLLIASRDAEADPLVRRLSAIARTGQHGDGKVFVLPLESALRIATGETGDDAL